MYEKVFTSDSGMRRNVPKVLVVVTDGRSQDDVKKSAEKLQHSGNHAAVDFCAAAEAHFQQFGNVGRFSHQSSWRPIFNKLFLFMNPHSEKKNACGYWMTNNSFVCVCVC